MVVVVAAEDCDAALEFLNASGETAFELGVIEHSSETREAFVTIVA